MKKGDVSRARRRGAFTLIEMLFVVIIIGLIAALVVGNVGKVFTKGQIKTTRAQIAQVSSAVEEFKADVSRYPTEQEGLKALVEQPQGVEKWAGPYFKKTKVPLDGWGNAFVYKLDTKYGFIIRSLGGDNKEGGEGEHADIDNLQ